MEYLKTFWTDLFTAMNTEDSIAVLVFLGVSFLLGLLFGAWSRAGKIKRLKRELAEKELGLKSLRTQYDLLVEQFEKKEDDLKIIGHADKTGGDAHNKDLGYRRANSAKLYIANQVGIQTEIKIESKGEKEPMATNKTPEGRAKNRRINLIIE